MKTNNLKGSLLLSLAALIWGLAFVAQSQSTKLIGAFTLNFSRSLIAAVVLLVFCILKGKSKKQTFLPTEPREKKSLLLGGFLCGTILTISVNLQQFGMGAYPDGVASEARAGFLTALYVILVPAVSVFVGKKVSPAVWGGVLIALGGVYMLCLSGGIDGIYLGDVLIFICAIFFTLHIMTVDHFVTYSNAIKLSALQMLTTAILSGILALIFETISMSSIIDAILPILYLGIMSSGVAYSLQIVGQKFATPAVASISMSLESVFAALGGWIIIGNSLSGRELIGCGLVFVAILVAQMPSREKK